MSHLSFWRTETLELERTEISAGKTPSVQTNNQGHSSSSSSSVRSSGPVELIASGEDHALQISVLGFLLQPLLVQQTHQFVSFLHHLHDLHQQALLLHQLTRTLLAVWKRRENKERPMVNNKQSQV